MIVLIENQFLAANRYDNFTLLKSTQKPLILPAKKLLISTVAKPNKTVTWIVREAYLDILDHG
ncbi:hypothetical protein [Herminiimonas arsenitoxidans]|jgi:hypothetical protein|uniref:hypothetical protein n=1 Tax=Herminiimonas arsenitoxidans TaxID=1809410 RepID=UPI000970D58D|nr:hypothetical protein [Herminiimonas arsenitoxidans]